MYYAAGVFSSFFFYSMCVGLWQCTGARLKYDIKSHSDFLNKYSKQQRTRASFVLLPSHKNIFYLLQPSFKPLSQTWTHICVIHKYTVLL